MGAGWSRLPDLPGTEGVAGPFVGGAGGTLVVAGGTNFEGGRPWNGGRKVWHDTVWTLEPEADEWTVAGRLPRPLGYGLSLSVGDALWCIGGGDAHAHAASVWCVHRRGSALQFDPGPALPRPSAYHAGAKIGNRLYIAGGQTGPHDDQAQWVFWTLNLDDVAAGWQELPAWEGPGRMMAVAGVVGNDFCLFGGYALARDGSGRLQRHFLRDAHCYTPGRGWRRLADLPRAVVGTPSPALGVDHTKLLLLGWNDGSLADHQPPESRPDFPTDLLMYDAAGDIWAVQGSAPFAAKVTPVAQWRGRIVIASGEIRPGVRSDQVWTLPAAHIADWYQKACRIGRGASPRGNL